MKKTAYEEPKLEIIRLTTADVLTVSPENPVTEMEEIPDKN